MSKKSGSCLTTQLQRSESTGWKQGSEQNYKCFNKIYTIIYHHTTMTYLSFWDIKKCICHNVSQIYIANYYIIYISQIIVDNYTRRSFPVKFYLHFLMLVLLSSSRTRTESVRGFGNDFCWRKWRGDWPYIIYAYQLFRIWTINLQTGSWWRLWGTNESLQDSLGICGNQSYSPEKIGKNGLRFNGSSIIDVTTQSQA